MPSCPKCSKDVSDLVPIDEGMKSDLEAKGIGNVDFPAVCVSCYAEFGSIASKGTKLRASQNAQDQNRKMIWKNRVHIIKKARKLLTHRAFNQAAEHYEKYLRVLEVVIKTPKDDLTPEDFSKANLTKEMNVLIFVLWDMVKVYDHLNKANDLKRVFTLLGRFTPKTKHGGEVIRRAERYAKKSKNSKMLKEYLRTVGGRSGFCFIATATYGSDYQHELTVLRRFRDIKLRSNKYGRNFIYYYYKLSPPLAKRIEKSALLKFLVRITLKPIIFTAAAYLRLQR